MIESTPPSRIALVALAAHLLIATTVVPLPAFAQDNASIPRRGEPITLNFSNADIEAVARTMAVVTGRDVVVDPRVRGTINLITDRAMAPTAAFNQFASALRLQGFAVVQADGLYKIVPEADAKLQANAVTTTTSGSSGVGSNQIVTQIFRLNYESPTNLLPVLRPLIPPNNTINVNPGNNSLVITDYADNMRRLGRIIAALDVPNASDVEVIPLRHSVASDLAPLIARLIEGGSGAVGGVPGAPGAIDASFRTTLIAEPRSNALILRAANPARAALVRTLVDKLDRPAAESSNGAAGNIYVIYLKNADAVRLASTLRAAMAADGRNSAVGTSATPLTAQASPQQPASNVLGSQGASAQTTTPVNNSNTPSTGGQIQADPSSNSLIITASEPQYRQLRAVIDKLDGRRAQVMIEALIVEVGDTAAAKFGVQWQSALGNNAALGTNSSVAGTNLLSLTKALAARDINGINLAPGLNLGITGKIGGQLILGAIASFFERDQDANVLSKPNLLTLDNEEAKIVIGQNVPFVTGQYASTTGAAGINPFTTVERKDVGLTLRVRPTINENGTVKMTIFQETSTVDQTTITNPNGPTTSKRSIESSVLVEDGGLVMIGGLLSDSYNNSVEKVPLAGDIPLLGNLFKSQARTREKVNLMMFLRPAVMRDAASTEAFSYDRYDEIRGLQQRLQPDASNVMLRAVDSANVLPELAPPGTQEVRSQRKDAQFGGTQLIPPPRRPEDTRRLAPSPLKGALPPTADPNSSRELP